MLIVGQRPEWLRVLLVPSQPFHRIFSIRPDGDLDPSNDLIISDPVTLRFESALVNGVRTEKFVVATPLPNGSVQIAMTAEQVNQFINDCGAFTRRVRLTLGNLTWASGYFEIEGEW